MYYIGTVARVLLQIRDLRCTLGGREVLRGVDLDVFEGETIVLLGRSGSGKTTLLKTLNRLILPSGGSIRFEDRALEQWDPIRLRRRMGYVIQDAGLFPHWTVAQNVALVPRLEGQGAEAIARRVDEMLEAVGLAPGEFRARFPRELSGGQRQRAGIARALAADPPVMLLDEPFAALDPITRLELQRLFLDLRARAGKTALFVTHDIREALRMGSRVALLHEGIMERIEPPEEFRRADSAEARAFLAGLDEEDAHA
jgi:osmoprotectant transport system ATP-binding protein